MSETVESRAVIIAARVMVAAGLCRYDDPSKCKKFTSALECEMCVRRWLIDKAKKELKGEKGR